MPIQGFIRFRKHQVGVAASTAFASNVSATRVLPYRGSIALEPNRETPDVDTGSLDPALSAFLGALDVTGTWEGKAAFDDLPYIYALGIKGDVTPTGSATGRVWTFQAASLTADVFNYVTDQWGDDVTTDVITGGGGVIDSWSLSFGEDLSAFDLNAQLIYARAGFAGGFTGGLTIDTTPNWLYGAHTIVHMDTVPAAIGTSPIADAVHGATFEVANNLDKKRFANGSNAGFTLAGYGRGPREITLTLQLAKTAATVAEAQTLDDSPVPVRYFDIVTTSTETVPGGSTPYRNSIRFPAELISRSDTEIANNSVLELVYRGKYDETLGYALRTTVTNGLATL
jgi:hypothetical protein